MKRKRRLEENRRVPAVPRRGPSRVQDGVVDQAGKASSDKGSPGLVAGSVPPDLVGQVLASLEAERELYGPTPLVVLGGSETCATVDGIGYLDEDAPLRAALAEVDELLPLLGRPARPDLVEQVVAALAADRRTLRRWVVEGRLPAVRHPDGVRRFRPEDIGQLRSYKYDGAARRALGESGSITGDGPAEPRRA